MRRNIPADFAEGRKIWSVDTEYLHLDGERVVPHCVCAMELRTGQRWEAWVGGPEPVPPPPWNPAEDVVLDYNGTAEHGVFLVLGWQFPKRHFDWLPELKVLHGTRIPAGLNPKDHPWALLSQAAVQGIATISAAEKDKFRGLAMRGGPYTQEERRVLLDYCWTDVDVLAELFHKTAPQLLRCVPEWSVERAYFRGSVVQAYTRITERGLPVDREIWPRLKVNWRHVVNALVAEVNTAWPLWRWNHKEQKYSLRLAKLLEVMAARRIPWPRTDTGKPCTDKDTLKSLALTYPQLVPVQEVFRTLGQFRLGESLAIGKDGRNRVDFRPFTSSTGRCQPSNAEFVFGTSAWVRSVLAPHDDMALAYVDLSAAEIAIAAVLSGDSVLWADYCSGDPYTRFGIGAGLIPMGGTKDTHEPQRDLAKRLMLAVGYGMQPVTLAGHLGVSLKKARRLLDAHKLRYHRYWDFSQSIENKYLAGESLHTLVGWRLAPERRSGGRIYITKKEQNALGPKNFPMQAGCSAILHRAVVLAERRGIRVVASVHDALLVEAPANQIKEVAQATVKVWQDASELVMGHRLRSDVKIVMPGERYRDKRGVELWDRVMDILVRIERDGPPPAPEPPPTPRGKRKVSTTTPPADTPPTAAVPVPEVAQV